MMRNSRDKHDVLSLLEDDVSYPGWEHQTGDTRSFYVRGFTWFRDNVLDKKLHVTDCGSHISTMKERLAERASWHTLKFQWDDRFSRRQFIDAASIMRKPPPKFQKAAEILLLCEVIADDLHAADPTRPSGDDIYKYMRIEAAVSYIHGFTRQAFEELPLRDKELLRQWTGQGANDVFQDMAEGLTVTQRLATRTRQFYATRVPELDLGGVGFRLSQRWRFGPSSNEHVDIGAQGLPGAEILDEIAGQV